MYSTSRSNASLAYPPTHVGRVLLQVKLNKYHWYFIGIGFLPHGTCFENCCIFFTFLTIINLVKVVSLIVQLSTLLDHFLPMFFWGKKMTTVFFPQALAAKLRPKRIPTSWSTWRLERRKRNGFFVSLEFLI